MEKIISKIIGIYPLLIGLPLLACLLIQVLRGTQKQREWGGKLSSWLTGICWALTFSCLFGQAPFTPFAGFLITRLSQVVVPLILFISWIVQTFSIRYMWGDRTFSKFFTRLSAITAGLFCLICADHIALFILSFALSYALLVGLIIHKKEWKASKQSGRVALKYLGCSFCLTTFAVCLISYQTNSFFLSEMINHRNLISTFGLTCALISLFVSALILSAAFPFHKWLISSLNAPTPVSALMHAGLINGGGLLLIRFAPLYEGQIVWMGSLLVCGLLTMTIGTCWTLIQPNIKRLLACSTLAQIGFMLMQIGLGLFPAAIAHLCWHGMFKSYLFLRSGSCLQEKSARKVSHRSPLAVYLLALLSACIGGLGFMLVFPIPVHSMSASLFMASIVGIATAQLAFEIGRRTAFFFSFVQTSLLSFAMGALYGTSVGLVEKLLLPDVSMAPLGAPALFWIALAIFMLPWIGMRCGLANYLKQTKWWKRFYVCMLNASQPEPRTVTTSKANYQY